MVILQKVELLEVFRLGGPCHDPYSFWVDIKKDLNIVVCQIAFLHSQVSQTLHFVQLSQTLWSQVFVVRQVEGAQVGW